MKIGVPKEIKTNENRIALVPAGAEALVAAGHTVFVEQGAGAEADFPTRRIVRSAPVSCLRPMMCGSKRK